jgi:hypothetical protein
MRRKLWIIPIGIAAVIIFAWLGGTIVQLLWNWLLPPLFGFPELSYWQALGMLALCRILFGGIGGRGGGHRGWAGSGMNREERERFRQRMRDRCADSAEKPLGPAAP